MTPTISADSFLKLAGYKWFQIYNLYTDLNMSYAQNYLSKLETDGKF